jgi:glyoxalase family protein
MMTIHGIHHITAIASDPQQTYDFYTQVLGLRLVKKSVNQDDTQTYHLFFGDKVGSPGLDLTFFTFQPAHQGHRGVGQVTTIALAVPESSLPFWLKRFAALNIKNDGLTQQFGKNLIYFYDHDNQKLALVGVDEATLPKNDSNVWTTAEISVTEAIRYFYSATLTVSSLNLIQPVLDVFGYKRVGADGFELLYQLGDNERAAYLIVEERSQSGSGLNMAGTVHHIAFAVEDEAAELAVRQQLLAIGLYPTEVIDRFYFKSVYFRTPAGILFELATEGPGFTADEDKATLGEKLALPPFLESQRAQIEAQLVPIILHKD